MNRCDFRHLQRQLLKLILTSVSLLTLSSCEMIPDSYGVFSNPLLDHQEYFCAALRMDENYFDITKLERGNWYALSLRDNSEVTLNVLINPESLVVRFPKFEAFGKSYTDRRFEKHHLGDKYAYSQIEKDHCERLFLREVSDVYSFEVGVPANSLDFTKPTYKDEIEKPVLFDINTRRIGYDTIVTPKTLPKIIKDEKKSITDEDVSSRVDWDLVQDFNLEAYEIWQSLQEDYTDEEIRRLYFDGKIKSVRALRESISLVLETSHFKTTYNQRKISHFHPLFAQILIDLFVTNNIVYSGVIKGVDEKQNYGSEEQANGEMVPWIYEEDIDKIIGNEEVPPNLEFGGKSIPDEGRLAASYTESVIYKRTMMVANIAVLLQTFSYKNCYEWGLRPEITRFLIPYRVSNGTSYLKNKEFRLQGNEGYEDHIAYSVMAACGDISHAEPTKYKEYFINLNLLSPYIINNDKEILNDAIRRAK